MKYKKLKKMAIVISTIGVFSSFTVESSNNLMFNIAIYCLILDILFFVVAQKFYKLSEYFIQSQCLLRKQAEKIIYVTQPVELPPDKKEVDDRRS